METVLRTYRDRDWSRLDVVVVASTERANMRAKMSAFLGAIRSVRRRSKGCLVHLHLSQRGSFLREGFIALVAALSGPVFVTIHGSSFVSTSQSRLWRPIYRAVLSRCAGVGVLNGDALAAASVLAPAVDIRVLPNPGPVPDGVLRSRMKSRRIVFAGSVGYRKGVDVLMAAWGRVAATVPSSSLDIVGPLDASLSEDLRLSIKDCWRGALAPEDVQTLLADAYCAVLPSRAEGQPMFLIEALGFGVPIVVTDVGGMPALAEGVGEVVPAGDPVALSDALIRLLLEPDLAERYSVAAFDKYAHGFSAAKHEKDLVDFYCPPLKVLREA